MKNVKSMKEVLSLLGEQMDELRPAENPGPKDVQAARATATLANSYVSIVRCGLECSKMKGTKPDLRFLGD